MLTQLEIRDSIEKQIKKWCEDYYQPFDRMILIARHCSWQNDKIMSDWVDNQDRLQFELGLIPRPDLRKDKRVNVSLPENNREKVCLSCYEPLDKTKFALMCGHTFCRECWRQHLVARLSAGINECTARCMQEGCNVVVTHSAFLELLDSKEQEHYWNNLTKSYTSEDRSIRWCSNKRCECCFKRSEFSSSNTVVCTQCGAETCLLCGSESH